MKQAIVFIFLILILVSCKEKIDSVQDVMNALAPDEQNSSIDPSVDNLIKGKKGTQIFIPANALRFKDGTIPTGKINIELKEFFSISDFISNNLSTTSDSFLLETGGMLYISATTDGKELVLDNSKSYTVAFPKNGLTKEMETFYGDTVAGKVNWSPAFRRGGEGDALGRLDSTLIDSSMFETKTSVCGHLASSGNSIDWKLKHRDSTIFLYVENNFPVTDSIVVNAICREGLIVDMELYISTNGKVTNVDFDTHYPRDSVTTPKYIRNYISAFLKSLPPFDMTSMQAYDPTSSYYLGLCCHTSLNWNMYNQRFREKYAQYLDKTVEKMGSEAINYYIMSSARLGWINCDRFLNDSTEKIDYIVRTTQPNNSKVMIAFDDIKSIMSGEIKNNEAVFRNVPVSSKIKVIGISYKDGKPLLSKMPTIVRKEPFELSGFKEFTLKTLEKELNN